MKKPAKPKTKTPPKSEAQQRVDYQKTANFRKGFSFECIRSNRQVLRASGYNVSLDPSEDI